VKMTDADNFCATHYHMEEEFAVDKADPRKQVIHLSSQYSLVCNKNQSCH